MPDGSIDGREFIVQDDRLAHIIRRIFFEKTATREEIVAFAEEVEKDPELAKEWALVKEQLSDSWGLK